LFIRELNKGTDIFLNLTVTLFSLLRNILSMASI